MPDNNVQVKVTAEYLNKKVRDLSERMIVERNSASTTCREQSPFLSLVETHSQVTSGTFIKLSTSVTAVEGWCSTFLKVWMQCICYY